MNSKLFCLFITADQTIFLYFVVGGGGWGGGFDSCGFFYDNSRTIGKQSSIFCQQNSSRSIIKNITTSLKVLTNEKRGGLKVLAFDRSPFKLFSPRFSAKSVQTPSFERLKTTQRILVLLFAIKNCFPIAVLRRRFMKKSGKLNCHVVN